MKESNVAVLMTCYNRKDVTLRCLRQFFAQKKPSGVSFDIYLVDDASPDNTGESVKSEFPNVNVIMGTGDLFWCKGMRCAWDAAIKSGVSYDFYLWLNDDVQFFDNAIETFFNDYKAVCVECGKPGIVVGAYSQTAGSEEAVYGLWDLQKRIIQPDGHPKWVKGDVMNGNLVLVPREIYERIGPIYGKYYHGFGDADYRMMAERAGYKVYSSSKILGVCPRTPEHYDDILTKPFIRRLKSLFGVQFGDAGATILNTFRYRYRNWGVTMAILSCSRYVFKVLFASGKR